MNPDEKRKRGRPRSFDRDKMLDVAMRAYWTDDPADVSLNAVCELAEVSKPAVYREFGSEDGLMRAVLERYAQEVLSEIFDILAPQRRLPEALESLIRFASEDPKMRTGCVFFKMRAGKHRLGPETRALVDAIDAGAVAAFTEYLDARRAAGDRMGDQPSSAAARYLVEQIGLALMQRAAGEGTGQSKAVLELALAQWLRG
jgi:AcrR family transcriptional regulator